MPDRQVVNNTILALDIKTKNFDILRGVDAIDIMPLEVGCISKLVILTRGNHAQKVSQLSFDGKYYGQSFLKEYKANKYSFEDIGGIKIVKNFTILSKYDVEVKIKTDQTQKCYALKGNDSAQKVRVNLPGNLIEFELRSYTNFADISAFEIEVMCDG